MNKIKLPSMVEYVKLQKENLKDYSLLSLSRKFELCDNFANFLSQQPNIGMFVPAVFEDGEWIVLEEPKTCCSGRDCGCMGMPYNYSSKVELDEYTTALDNVIFEGFVKCNRTEIDTIECLYNEDLNLHLEASFKYEKTIEDLLDFNLTLNPKFSKELGLI